MKRLVPAATTSLALAGALVGLPAAAHAQSWPSVEEGQRGANVTTVQHLLVHHEHVTEVDGIFGPDTQQKVTDFQNANDLDATGAVGEETWPAMTVELQEGSDAEDAVMAAQVQLAKHGHDVDTTGTFDESVTEAVTAFQEDHEIEASGEVDETTWQLLVETSGPTGDYALPLDRNAADRDAYDQPHHTYPAIDIGVGEGTPVYAVNGGSATPIDIGGACGYGVLINGTDGGEYTYCHFQEVTVVSGDVEAGELIGYSGNTGESSGPHLHLQLRYGGDLVCPQPLLGAIYDEEEPPSLDELPTTGCIS